MPEWWWKCHDGVVECDNASHWFQALHHFIYLSENRYGTLPHQDGVGATERVVSIGHLSKKAFWCCFLFVGRDLKFKLCMFSAVFVFLIHLSSTQPHTIAPYSHMLPSRKCTISAQISDRKKVKTWSRTYLREGFWCKLRALIRLLALVLRLGINSANRATTQKDILLSLQSKAAPKSKWKWKNVSSFFSYLPTGGLSTVADDSVGSHETAPFRCCHYRVLLHYNKVHSLCNMFVMGVCHILCEWVVFVRFKSCVTDIF